VPERPQLVVTFKKWDVISGYCSVCQVTFTIYEDGVSFPQLQKAFEEHVEQSHPGEAARASVA
jgi:hypothetical protein